MNKFLLLSCLFSFLRIWAKKFGPGNPFCHLICTYSLRLCFFSRKETGKKADCKMMVKLTTGHLRRKIVSLKRQTCAKRSPRTNREQCIHSFPSYLQSLLGPKKLRKCQAKLHIKNIGTKYVLGLSMNYVTHSSMRERKP